jgi:SAM-dependent methyltransferase
MIHKDQTYRSFLDKWEKNTQLAFSETLREGSDIFDWILTRNGFKSPESLRVYLSAKSRILDAGCGNGRVTALLHSYAKNGSEIMGVDLTAAHVAAENLRDLSGVRIKQKDLLDDLSDLGLFDFIYCQEVLHHTADPKGAFLNLTKQLADGGEIAIYVYKLKAPIREYADDYIRERIADLPYEKAMDSMRELTEFGRILSDLNIKVTVPKVDVIGIEAGEYDIQRLFYHHFFKCFWNAELGYEENVAINYDWYHPQLCTRHTIHEILGWFSEAGLKVEHQLVDYYGITVRGRKVA